MLTSSTGCLALWLMACAAASRALTRLLIGLLAAHATRKALSQPDTPRDEPEAAERLRIHRLAVLRTLLNGLKALGPTHRLRRGNE
ncbi:hypothetical protein ACFWPU_10620 [Streptomyces sp. NPDC058471]|uniref:hypothetical protein n=1 Tax=Streptomyces sp. NPDC058471 TaxID=3346516 RepID=UPI00365CDBEE